MTARRATTAAVPRSVAGLEARECLVRGMGRALAAIRPTFGPRGRYVMAARHGIGPELLTDGGVVARRLLAVADPYEDMGVQVIRDLAAGMVERVGDGAVAAALIAERLARAALAQSLARPDDGDRFEQAVDAALADVVGRLRAEAAALEPEDLGGALEAAGADRELARLVGEAYGPLGPDGEAIVQPGLAAGVSFEFREGIAWDAPVLARWVGNPDRDTSSIAYARVVVTDHKIADEAQLRRVLRAVADAGAAFVVAGGIASELMPVGARLARSQGLDVLVVAPPSGNVESAAVLEDLAVYAGARVITRWAGMALERLAPEDCGTARHAHVDAHGFGLLGGGGDAGRVRRRADEVRQALRALDSDRQAFAPGEEDGRPRLRRRLAELTGRVCVIRVGGVTDTERDVRRADVERLVRTARAALSGGVVAGGGAALYAAALAARAERDHAAEALLAACAEPFRCVVANAGVEPEAALARLAREPHGSAFDVVGRRWLAPGQRAVVDPVETVVAALESAWSATRRVRRVERLVRSGGGRAAA